MRKIQQPSLYATIPIKPLIKKPLLKNPLKKPLKKNKLYDFYKKWKISVISFIYIVFTGVVFFAGYGVAEKIFIPKNIFIMNTNINVTGLEVNKYAVNDLDFFVQSYANKEKISKQKSGLMIHYALLYEVPINMAFSVAYNESRYNENAKNVLNKNGSYDYGIMQLNSLTFPDVKVNAPIDKNISQGLSYLKWCYDKNQSWDLAYVEYNCGAIKNYENVNKEHLNKIFSKERELDAWISTVIRDKINRDAN
jgi:hypothetical protein